jgi:hypothetical protein
VCPTCREEAISVRREDPYQDQGFPGHPWSGGNGAESYARIVPSSLPEKRSLPLSIISRQFTVSRCPTIVCRTTESDWNAVDFGAGSSAPLNGGNPTPFAPHDRASSSTAAARRDAANKPYTCILGGPLCKGGGPLREREIRFSFVPRPVSEFDLGSILIHPCSLAWPGGDLGRC